MPNLLNESQKWLGRWQNAQRKWGSTQHIIGANAEVAIMVARLDPSQGGFLGGALSAVRAQCRRSATIWVSSHIGDPYFVILGASLLPLA